MYAIIVTGGKQYKVAEGDTIYVEKLEANDGDAVQFDNVLVVEKDGAVAVGAPKVEGASVSGKVVKTARARRSWSSNIKPRKTTDGARATDSPTPRLPSKKSMRNLRSVLPLLQSEV